MWSGEVTADQAALRDADRACDLAVRQALLAMVDALERKWEHEPRTAELRKMWKQAGDRLRGELLALLAE